MSLFLMIVVAVSSVGAFTLSAVRLYLEWRRTRDVAWETTIRLMVSDPDGRVRSNDFADLYTDLRYLRKHPDCLSSGHRTLKEAMASDSKPQA